MPEILANISSPEDVKKLDEKDLTQLADELRTKIIHGVSKTGGHLASSLGTVELTVALCKVFSFPQDKVVWDVGHQSYAWKILTGRAEKFSTLRTFGGIGGFPRPSESPYDSFIGGHAGVAISAALGFAAVRDRHHETNDIIAIVGDGALTNGVSLEALNNIRYTTNRLILIINDNEMSISQNVGALSRMLGKRLGSLRYNRIKHAAEAAGHKLHFSGLRSTYHAMESAIKSLILRNKSAVFEGLGLRYIGPIDGHNLHELENALQSSREAKEPVVLHIGTVKGKGFSPAEKNPSFWHGIGAFHVATASEVVKKITPANDYSECTGSTLIELAEKNDKIVAITAAMRDGTGLKDFFKKFPKQSFDVGICEEHACTFAAGLAIAGLHPFVIIYSTFMQRALDNVMHDICLQNLPVTLLLDRAGSVGADGPTHHGLYDIAIFRPLPNLIMMQPSSRAELREMLKFAGTIQTPTMIRYPRKLGFGEIEHKVEQLQLGKFQVLETDGATCDVAIFALGDCVAMTREITDILKKNKITSTIINARFIKPLDTNAIQKYAKSVKRIVTLENGTVCGGFGSAVEAEINAICPIMKFGWPDVFIQQGTDGELQNEYGFTAEKIAKEIIGNLIS